MKEEVVGWAGSHWIFLNRSGLFLSVCVCARDSFHRLVIFWATVKRPLVEWNVTAIIRLPSWLNCRWFRRLSSYYYTSREIKEEGGGKAVNWNPRSFLLNASLLSVCRRCVCRNVFRSIEISAPRPVSNCAFVSIEIPFLPFGTSVHSEFNETHFFNSRISKIKKKTNKKCDF